MILSIKIFVRRTNSKVIKTSMEEVAFRPPFLGSSSLSSAANYFSSRDILINNN
jgi:hypothetical protein